MVAASCPGSVPGALGDRADWLDVRCVGQGLATEAVALLTDAALGIGDVNGVEIRCDQA